MLAEHGTLVQPDAMKYILSKNDPVLYVSSLINKSKEYPLILTVNNLNQKENIENRVEASSVHDINTDAVSQLSTSPHIFSKAGNIMAKDYPSDIKILSDVSGNSTCEGTVDDFAKYFRSRYESIKKLLRNRREMFGVSSINMVKQIDSEIKIMGIVKKISVTKKGHKLIEIEDETGEMTGLVPNNSPLISETVLNDEVIGVVGRLSSKTGMMNIKSIVRPEIMMRKNNNRAEIPLSAAFVSDLHVGNKTFLSEAWEKLMKWLSSDEASNIKYIVIPGDAVDGIGVYPNQEDELLISDIFTQYEKLAELLSEIPEHIQIIISPGNHDAVRQAEPQPCFPENIRKLFSDNVLFVGNPCYLTLNGVEILLYHGRSMDDFVTNVQSLTYNTPIAIMKEMLKRRHLAPIYGGRTPIAPEQKDYLVIDRVPDIFVTGHVHSAGVGVYRNVTLINASAWQSQTNYQKEHNFVPDPGKIMITNLQTLKTRIMKFV